MKGGQKKYRMLRTFLLYMYFLGRKKKVPNGDRCELLDQAYIHLSQMRSLETLTHILIASTLPILSYIGFHIPLSRVFEKIHTRTLFLFGLV